MVAVADAKLGDLRAGAVTSKCSYLHELCVAEIASRTATEGGGMGPPLGSITRHATVS
jgi:hypothetical protein